MLVIDDGNTCVFEFESAPELNLQATFAIDKDAIRLTVGGEEIVMAGPNRVAFNREQTKRDGRLIGSAKQIHEPAAISVASNEKDYGPVIRGDAYLLLGEWVNKGGNRLPSNRCPSGFLR